MQLGLLFAMSTAYWKRGRRAKSATTPNQLELKRIVAKLEIGYDIAKHVSYADPEQGQEDNNNECYEYNN